MSLSKDRLIFNDIRKKTVLYYYFYNEELVWAQVFNLNALQNPEVKKLKTLDVLNQSTKKLNRGTSLLSNKYNLFSVVNFVKSHPVARAQ